MIYLTSIFLSALPNNVAEVVEPSLVAREYPFLTPAHLEELLESTCDSEINPEDMRSYYGHACATNCTVVPVVTPIISLKSLGLISVTIHTRQALSGAGWRLLYDDDALAGNVNPIPGEEEKLIAELKYLLGMEIPVIASCNRVPERDGHFVSCGVEVEKETSLEVLKLMNIPTLDLPHRRRR